MTLCAYCHHWLIDCTCVVGFLPTEKSVGTNPGETQFAGEKDCSTDAVSWAPAAHKHDPGLAGASLVSGAAAGVE